MAKNCILIGYRGVGKSTVAKALQISLRLPLCSTDALIEEHLGMEIEDYLKNHSWDAFRAVESEMISKIIYRGPLIIDCGGGVVEKQENMRHLKKEAVVFWLKASVPTILERMAVTGNRPRLTSAKSMEEEVTQVLKKRTPLYKEASDHTISVEGDELFKAPSLIAEIYQREISRG